MREAFGNRNLRFSGDDAWAWAATSGEIAALFFMAFIDMISELTGCLPRMSIDYARTLVNRAYRDVRRQNLWSFQLAEANWVSPNLINAGMCYPTQGFNTVSFDLAGSAAITAVALNAGVFPTNIIARQFRVGISTIYNIWGYAVDGNGIVTLTLDRPFTDTAQTAGFNQGGFGGGGFGGAIPVPYSIFQCYYAAPVEDFLTWINVRDILNFNDLVTTLTRKEIDERDPQRTIFYLPTHVVGYQPDLNPASPTFRYYTFELWGQPQYPLVYQLYYIRKGVPLVNDSDMLPVALGEDCVMALARKYAYEWGESTKGDVPRNVGSDFKFLMGAAGADYKRLYSEYRRQDRETVDSWFEIRRHRSWLSNTDGYYNSIGQTANPGSPW